jgi:hypothetical protein
MPHGYVTKVTFKAGDIVLTVVLDEYLANEPVEISGFATQNSGGFAIFNDTQSVQENPDGTVIIYVKATPSVEFNTGEDVTVSLRVATVWVTVLGEGQDGPEYSKPEGTPTQDGETWSIVKAVGYPKP